MQLLQVIYVTLMVPACICVTVKSSLDPNCLCDVSDICDYECCCDSSCSLGKSSWEEAGACNDDNLGIPMCTYYENTEPNKRQLYSGSETILAVVKRLFCIDRVNFVDITAGITETLTADQIDAALSGTQTVTATNPLVSQLPSLDVPDGLPLRGTNGQCQLTNNSTIVLKAKMDHINKKCRILSNNIGSLYNNTLTRYDIRESANTNPTACTTACPRPRQYVLNFYPNGSLATALSYIIADNGSSSGYVTILYSYKYVTTNNLSRSAMLGYDIGTPLQFMYKDTSGNYFQIENALNLAFRATDGTCYDSTKTSSFVDIGSIVSINFGENSVFSCYDSTGNSEPFKNITQAFNHVGIIGSATNILEDYLKITYSGNIDSLRLSFWYMNIGAQENRQYRIVKAEMTGVATTTTTSHQQPSLFVEFQSIDNKVSLFIPSPPSVDAYLPNDFLYPFYVA